MRKIFRYCWPTIVKLSIFEDMFSFRVINWDTLLSILWRGNVCHDSWLMRQWIYQCQNSWMKHILEPPIEKLISKFVGFPSPNTKDGDLVFIRTCSDHLQRFSFLNFVQWYSNISGWFDYLWPCLSIFLFEFRGISANTHGSLLIFQSTLLSYKL